MSTASRNQRPDAPAHEIMQAAAERALGSRRRLRLFAVAAWCAFLGAIPILATALAVLPPDAAPLHLGPLSLAFLVTWALVMVPVSLALLLTGPHGPQPHGR